MTHLSVEQLLACRESGLEPGIAAARAHLEACPACQAEAARLDQRAARLRALPALRPARDHWSAVRGRLTAEVRRRRVHRAVWVGLALAAGLAIVVGLKRSGNEVPRHELAISEAMTRSSQLEQLIQSYNPDQRVTNGRTVQMAAQLEDRIAVLDRELEMAQLRSTPDRDDRLLRLWRQRVGLLDALVDVHLTRAQAVGF
jgi:parvulin-like peptidyl-prolyl isomerase